MKKALLATIGLFGLALAGQATAADPSGLQGAAAAASLCTVWGLVCRRQRRCCDVRLELGQSRFVGQK